MFDKHSGLKSEDVLSTGLKVMGLILLLEALVRLINAVITVAVSYSDQFTKAYFVVHPMWDVRVLGAVVLKILIAIVVLCYADRLARQFSGANESVVLQRIGFRIAGVMLGVYLVAKGIPRVADYLANVYQLGISRSAIDGALPDTFQGAFGIKWPPCIEIGLGLVIGVYLIFGARHLLDLIYGRLSEVEEVSEVA